MKELLVITYQNTKKACYFTPISAWLQESIQKQIDDWLIVTDTIEITEKQSEELRKCSLDRFYQIIDNA